MTFKTTRESGGWDITQLALMASDWSILTAGATNTIQYEVERLQMHCPHSKNIDLPRKYTKGLTTQMPNPLREAQDYS